MAVVTDAQRDEWEAGLAQQILQSCSGLLAELERIKLNVQGDTARDVCSAEWAAMEARMEAMLQAKPSGLARASRQTVGALRTCVQSLASSTALEAADGPTLRATTMALHAAAAGLMEKLHNTRRGVADGQAECNSIVKDVLQEATALAELLRIFTRVSQQSWAATRSQLAHAPSVPSPLASGSAMRHRRWVSEEIDAETPAAPGLQISVDGRPFGPDARRLPAPSSHSRNRSDSRLLVGATPLPRKSALSLRRPSQQLTAPPSSEDRLGADLPERSKQVRFSTDAP
ncbi:hypothetical protein IWW38_004304, partial [Coemansia aciculifera]